MRYEITDPEWNAIKPMRPNKPRGAPRVNDRRVLNGIFWVLRSGAVWGGLGRPGATCHKASARIPPATIASLAGAVQESGVGSWTPFQALKKTPFK